MAIDLDIVGKRLEPTPYTYTEDNVILYALGIGAGLDEMDFIYEKNLKVFPSYAVIPFMPTLLNVFVPTARLNMYKVLHGEHQVLLHKSIPTSGTLYTTTICNSIYDKADKGALVNLTFETRNATGELIFENRAAIVDRSAGNFGGDRGPKTEPVNPPEGKAPDFSISYSIPTHQCALYRLSGDKNPLHIDPEFAKKGGFDRPILHGLCSVGYACRAIIHSVCGSNPDRFKSFSLRFMNVAFPGDTLITKGWRSNDNQYVIQVVNQNGKIILGNAAVTTT
jgi:acyl dehydratase